MACRVRGISSSYRRSGSSPACRRCTSVAKRDEGGRTRALHRRRWFIVVIAIVVATVGCASTAIEQRAKDPPPLPPNPDVGCAGALAEALDLGAIRQRRDCCDRAFECEARRPRSYDVTRVRVVMDGDRAVVSRTTGRLDGHSYDALYSSTRECREVSADAAAAALAVFRDETTTDECRAAMAARDEFMFSIDVITLRTQEMFCGDRLTLDKKCAVFGGDVPRENIKRACQAAFDLAGVRLE